MIRIASTIVFLSLVACDKGSGAKPVNANPSTQQPTQPKSNLPSAPATIPSNYVAIFEKNWSKIEALGAKFETQFKTAQESRGRDKAAVDAANETYKELADLWSVVAYAAQDENDKIQEAWAKHLSSYETRVKVWTNKSKGLAQFSRVK